MNSDDTGNTRLLSLVPLAISWSALMLAASVSGLWFLLAERWPGAFFLLAAPLALLAAAGILRQHFRSRATRRWLAALDGYAQREIAQAQRRTTRLRAQIPFTTRRASGQFPLPSA
jgi:signal transduction histidine kinase